MSVNQMPCGDNLQWTYGYGKLVVSPVEPSKPAGEMWDNWSVPSEWEPEHLHIAEGVTRIGDEAFKDCASLEDVWMPDSLEEIGEGAFAGCGNLEELYISENLTTIEAEAFRNTGIESLSIPKSVEVIKEYAFADCPILVDVEVDAAKIEEGAFQNSAIENLSIGNNVKSIGAEAFADNDLNGKIVLPNVSQISENAFYGAYDAEFVANDNIAVALKEEGLNARTPTLAEQIESAKAEAGRTDFDENNAPKIDDISDNFSL